IPYQYRDHALFVAFAPYEKPEVAVAVVVEHGEHGGSSAAPIAGAILRAYFEGKGVIRKPVQQRVSSGGSLPAGRKGAGRTDDIEGQEDDDRQKAGD
ncbi:MAG TPA: penicillin-binding transpeptidase domain-containing protein, partial [Verrucomicrobiae bacterium]|nr:penicillin-binding transpeptidase domain-containing protein [Verrucomicrobiae bacterium]